MKWFIQLVKAEGNATIPVGLKKEYASRRLAAVALRSLATRGQPITKDFDNSIYYVRTA